MTITKVGTKMSVDVRKRFQVVSLGDVRIARAYLVQMGMKARL